jgi:hypothetical protein
MRQYYLVHIGKCGGSTVRRALINNNIEYKLVHVAPAVIQKYTNGKNIKEQIKYVVTIRDPITRFISGFNWKYYTCSIGKDMKNTRPNELKGFKYWKTVNRLAENIFTKSGSLNNKAYSFIKNDCNHLQCDINFYLEGILPHINKSNCIVIRQEHLNKDIRKKMNIVIKQNMKYTSSFSDYTYEKYLSALAIKNIRKFLQNDYKCITKLRELGLIPKKYYHKIMSNAFVKEYTNKRKKSVLLKK